MSSKAEEQQAASKRALDKRLHEQAAAQEAASKKLHEQAAAQEAASKSKQVASKRAKAKSGGKDMQKIIVIGVCVVVCVVAVLLALNDNPLRGKGKSLRFEAYVNDDSLISHTNSAADGNFTAETAQFFDKWTIGDAQYGLGGIGLPGMDNMDSDIHSLLPSALIKACDDDDSDEEGNVPPSYDARTDNANCFGEVRNSGNCSSSYAIAAADAIAARYCIQDSMKYSGLRLSPQQILSCDKKSNGCNGGGIDSVWAYIEKRGLYPDECLPYNGTGKDQTACKTECKEDKKLKILDHCVLKNPKHIKREIYNHGPVVLPIYLKQEYLTYSSGVYHPTEGSDFIYDGRTAVHNEGKVSGSPMLHAVMVLGWGRSQGQPYWLVRHSWGPEWGENGYARLSQSAEIIQDDYVLTGTPATEENIKAAAVKEEEAQKRKAGAKKEREERNARIAEARGKEAAEATAKKDAADLADMDDADFDAQVDLDEAK